MAAPFGLGDRPAQRGTATELLLQNEYLATENRILKALLARLASAMTRGKLWRRSEGGSAARRWKRLPASQNPIPSSAGIEDSLPTSSTAQRSADLPVGRELVRRPNIECYVWRERIPAGVTTASSEPWPTWGMRCRTRPSATSRPPWDRSRPEAESNHQLEGLHPQSHGRPGGNGLLHG
jgi:hypothetical protein